jgi:hypothetical protein
MYYCLAMHYKKCFKCLIEKPIIEFYKHSKMADGHLNKCKNCTREDAARTLAINKKNTEWVEKEKERVRIKQREKAKSEKVLIYQQVKRALTSGVIKKSPCEICGEKRTQGHHEDYSKPLKLNWLCIRHHNDRHNYLDSMELLGKKPLTINGWKKKYYATL